MRSTPGRLADVVPFSWVDGPGNRFVVFVQGCSFDCIACHNPDTIPGRCPSSRLATVGDLVEEIRAVEPYLAGITVSGGEATAQHRFVHDLFAEVKADPQLSRLTTFVDSNGNAVRPVWDQLLPVMDGAMIDLKALDPEVHLRLTGHTNERVLDAIHYLHERRRLYEVRLLLVPGMNDSSDQLARTGDWLAALDPAVRVVVIGFRRNGVRPAYEGLAEASPELLVASREILEGAGLREVVTV